MQIVWFIALLSVLSSIARAQNPNAFDPLLDEQPYTNSSRFTSDSSRGTGFTVSTAAGVYAGQVKSYLTPDESRLLQGTRPSLGFGLGYRFNSPIELAIDTTLGLGETFDLDHLQGKQAFDVFLSPRLFFHWYDAWPVSLYSGLGGLLGLFDLETEGVSQAGLGPTALTGIALRSDRSFSFYLETSACYFYDALAYSLSEKNAGDSTIQSGKKIHGDWFTVFRINIGIRLTNF